jgi:uncharacterized surface protein with fasciclin (FAS1) repeats
MASDVVNLSDATTVQSNDIEIKVSGSTVMVDNAKVLKTDITTSNGVIHIIDKVMMP